MDCLWTFGYKISIEKHLGLGIQSRMDQVKFLEDSLNFTRSTLGYLDPYRA